MSYALVIDGSIEKVGGLPGSARLLSTGDWLCPPGGLIEATQEQRESCGWFAVVDVVPAFNQATQTVDRGAVELVAGVPTVKYTVRALTAAELAAIADNTSRDAKAVTVAQAIPWLRQQAATAAGVTVTSGNAVATLQALVRNVGTFYGHFADFLEAQRFDQR